MDRALQQHPTTHRHRQPPTPRSRQQPHREQQLAQQDERMHIRVANASDAAAVRGIYGPVIETTAISFELVVPSEDEMAARITGRQPEHPWLVAEGEDGDGVLGYAYAGRFSGRAAY